jgi:hypothetical protein
MKKRKTSGATSPVRDSKPEDPSSREEMSAKVSVMGGMATTALVMTRAAPSAGAMKEVEEVAPPPYLRAVSPISPEVEEVREVTLVVRVPAI